MTRRVVAIDDSSFALEVIAEALENYDVELFTTTSAGEFMRRVLSGVRPDLIITDLEMPSMSGEEICRQLRQNPKTKGVPIVILSSKSTAQLEPVAQRLKVRGFISKAGFADGAVRRVLLPILGL